MALVHAMSNTARPRPHPKGIPEASQLNSVAHVAHIQYVQINSDRYLQPVTSLDEVTFTYRAGINRPAHIASECNNGRPFENRGGHVGMQFKIKESHPMVTIHVAQNNASTTSRIQPRLGGMHRRDGIISRHNARSANGTCTS
jgi:hypothetical protein